MRKFKNQKGITLIALVLTIIILIILAGVAVDLAIRGGLFDRIQEAGENTKISAAEEKILLATYSYYAGDDYLYNELRKIDGLERITPEEESSEFEVIVDGYKFKVIKEDNGNVRVEREGKDTGIAPTIESVTQQAVSNAEAKINVIAKTDDEQGIKEIILINNETEIETKNVSGKNVSEQFTITSNGTYTVKVNGQNGKNVTSEEIEVTSITLLNGSVTAGQITEGKVNITVTASMQSGSLQKMDLYEFNTAEGKQSATKIKTEQLSGQQTEKTYNLQLEFYVEKSYYAILNDEVETEVLSGIKNIDSIYTGKDLINLRNEVNINDNHFTNKTITQYSGISLYELVPIGYSTWTSGSDYCVGKYFSGTYNGNGKYIQIDKLASSLPEDFVWGIGIFGLVRDGTVKNLSTFGTISNSSIEGIGGVVGLLKGSSVGSAKIQNCSSYMNITSNSTSGGICGYLDKGTITDCTNYKPVTGADNIGGICGLVTEGVITSCTNTTDAIITGNRCVGGICGDIEQNIQMSKCYNTKKIVGKDYIGGIIGLVQKGGSNTISICCNLGYVNGISGGSNGFAGGIVGAIDGGTVTISYCFNANDIKGINQAGGIVGHASNYNVYMMDLTISNCCAYGTRTATYDKGCFIGKVNKETDKWSSYPIKISKVTINYSYADHNYSVIGYTQSGASTTINHESGYVADGEIWYNTSGENSMVYWFNGGSNSGNWTIDTRNVSKKICYGAPYLKDIEVPAEWTWGQ